MSTSVAVVALAASTSPALAQTVWTGAVSENWFDNSNWTNGVPVNIQDVIIDITDPAFPVLDNQNASAGDLTVGESGWGRLIVHNTSNLQTQTINLGGNEGSRGELYVNFGSTLNVDVLTVGESGEGVLGSTDGHIISEQSVLGSDPGSIGFFGLHDGALWESGSYLVVGERGQGNLTIEGSSVVVTDGDATLAEYAGSAGSVNLFGLGSAWNVSNLLTVGYGGTASLRIGSGAEVNSAAGIIGTEIGSLGQAYVHGGEWNTTSLFRLGVFGRGELYISGEGTVISDGLDIGLQGGSGFLRVRHLASSLESTADLTVGFDGTGTMVIDEGGRVQNVNGYLGYSAGSTGQVTIAGIGSRWDNFNELTVGREGSGHLEVTGGGLLNSAWTALGHLESGVGSLTVSGAGSTWNTGSDVSVGYEGLGTLTVTDGAEISTSHTFIGRSARSQGHVTIDGPNTTWTNISTLTVGNEGRGSLLITGGATVTDQAAMIGRHLGSEGSVLVGAGSTWNTGDLLVGQFGSGSLIVGAGGMVTANAVSIAAEPGSAGWLLLNGTLAGTGGLAVQAGGWLGGNGTAAADAVLSGVLAPGENGIGTLHVNGSFTAEAGSRYQVELGAGGSSDLVQITDAATLNGGTVAVLPLPNLSPSATYTILTAAGGVTGNFDEVLENFYFLSAELSYQPTSVLLSFQLDHTLESAALTPNQKGAAAGIESLGPGAELWNAVALLGSPEEAREAFDATSGEIHGSAKTALIEDARFVREAMLARVAAAFDGDVGNGLPVMGYGAGGPERIGAETERFGLWAHGFGAWGKIDSDGNAAELERSTGGFLVGGDAPVGESWRLGLVTGYSRSSFDVDGRASSGDSSNLHFGLYGGGDFGAIGLRFGAAHSWHDIETSRAVAFTGFADTVTSEYDAATAQLFGEVGYKLSMGSVALEPFAGVAYVNLDTDGFTERGGAATVSSPGGTTEATFSTLGLRGSADLALGGIDATARAMLGWRHAFGDITPESIHAFAGGEPFTIYGVPIAEDAILLEAGLDFSLTEAATLAISYHGQLASEGNYHGARATLGLRF
ncbi:autotransporter domain-containing protein [Chelativorans sp.]|uniref:autotransporter outer membrane beta-barrel domain-containing protein n=1 Tax=Chelativorans sp. TaxID=2203393 RepID=UPI002810ED53|nr:autotransporter domain-containing protein [Chelativorans sp.]